MTKRLKYKRKRKGYGVYNTRFCNVMSLVLHRQRKVSVAVTRRYKKGYITFEEFEKLYAIKNQLQTQRVLNKKKKRWDNDTKMESVAK